MPKRTEFINFLKQLLEIQDGTEKAIHEIDEYFTNNKNIREKAEIILKNKENHKKMIGEVIGLI